MATEFVFLLVLTRILGMLLTAPLLGSRSIPMRFRIGLGVLLAIFTCNLIEPPNLPGSAPVAWFMSEAAIGLMIGLGILIVFSAAQMAGTVVSQMAGLQLPGNLDPQTGQPGSPVSQLFCILSLAAFAVINGPELLVSATIDSFVSIPPGSPLAFENILPLTTSLLQQSFTMTLRGVAPAVAAMMISTVVIGGISRTYPQINLFSLGLNSNLVIMFLAISLTLSGCVWLFIDDLNGYLSTIVESLGSSQITTQQVSR